MSLDMVKYVVAGAIALVLLVLGLIAAALIVKGGPTTAAQLTTLLGVVGTLVSILAALLVAGASAKGTSDVQQLVNGHLDAHTQALPEQIRTVVADELAKYPQLAQIPPPPSGGAPGGSAT